MIVNLGSKENKESTWKDCFGIILCNKNEKHGNTGKRNVSANGNM